MIVAASETVAPAAPSEGEKDPVEGGNGDGTETGTETGGETV